jgi:hypothetical protein
MVGRAAVLLVALFGMCVPARAADTPSAKWKYDNPFCQVIAQAARTSDGSGYGLALFAAGGEKVDAHVTLITQTDAYDADVNVLLSGPPDDRQTGAVLVKLPASAAVQYSFVDSYVLDGNGAVTCPSYVFPLDDSTTSVPAGVEAIVAQHLQALGPLKCGHAYTPPQMRGDLQSPVGMNYGDRPLTVVARAYVDSNGYSIKEDIVQSSGVDGLDKYMLGAVGVHQFAPAQFLCVPVVGETEVELKYYP